MKLFWVAACVIEAIRLVSQAAFGDSLFGEALWARGLDALCAGMFLIAAFAAFRIKVAWTF